MTAFAQGFKYAGAHIKSREIVKNMALIRPKRNFEHKMVISQNGRQAIDSWLSNIKAQHKPIELGVFATVITADASLGGLRAHRPDHSTAGRWLLKEANDHINVLELIAIYLGLQSLVALIGKQIDVFTDNLTV
jgi:hypothetical protein